MNTCQVGSAVVTVDACPAHSQASTARPSPAQRAPPCPTRRPGPLPAPSPAVASAHPSPIPRTCPPDSISRNHRPELSKFDHVFPTYVLKIFRRRVHSPLHRPHSFSSCAVSSAETKGVPARSGSRCARAVLIYTHASMHAHRVRRLSVSLHAIYTFDRHTALGMPRAPMRYAPGLPGAGEGISVTHRVPNLRDFRRQLLVRRCALQFRHL